jgi:hypothetical protein
MTECCTKYWILFVVLLFPFLSHGATASSGPGPTHYQGFMITLRLTTLGRTPLGERSSQSWDIYLTTHNICKNPTSMPQAGFEPTIPARKRPQTQDLEPSFNNTYTNTTPNPVAARSKGGSETPRLLGLRVKSCRGHGRLSRVNVACCQEEVSASGWSLVQRIPTECGVSEYDREDSIMRRHWPTGVCCDMMGRIINIRISSQFNIWGQRES